MNMLIPMCLMIPRKPQLSPAPTAATLERPSETLLRSVRETFKKKSAVKVWFSPRSGNA